MQCARYDVRCDNGDDAEKGARYKKPQYMERGLTECDARLQEKEEASIHGEYFAPSGEMNT